MNIQFSEKVQRPDRSRPDRRSRNEDSRGYARERLLRFYGMDHALILDFRLSVTTKNRRKIFFGVQPEDPTNRNWKKRPSYKDSFMGVNINIRIYKYKNKKKYN